MGSKEKADTEPDEYLKNKEERKRSRSTCSEDSEAKRKRRNACSKDKRKKSKRRCSTSSSSSSSASSREPKVHRSRSKRHDGRVSKSKGYENGIEHQRTNPFIKEYRGNYKGYKQFSDYRRKRGNFNFRPYKHYNFQDRNRRGGYNNYPYNRYGERYGEERRNYRFSSHNNKESVYNRSRSRSNQESCSDYQKGVKDTGESVKREDSKEGHTKHFRASSNVDKTETVKHTTEMTRIKGKDKRAENLEEKTDRGTHKKARRRRSASSSSSSSVSSSSSDNSSTSSSSSSSSSSSDSSSSSTNTSEDERRRKKAKKKAKKLKKAMKRRKKKKKMKKKLKKKLRKSSGKKKTRDVDKSKEGLLRDIPPEITEKAKAMAPMTKEEWEKKQSVMRRVYDDETGRYRLIKGDGEVLEEIVSRERHKDINKQATKGDGEYFQARLRMNAL